MTMRKSAHDESIDPATVSAPVDVGSTAVNRWGTRDFRRSGHACVSAAANDDPGPLFSFQPDR